MTFASKLAAGAIAVIAAAIVLASDDSRFASTRLSIASGVVVCVGVIVPRRHSRASVARPVRPETST